MKQMQFDPHARLKVLQRLFTSDIDHVYSTLTVFEVFVTVHKPPHDCFRAVGIDKELTRLALASLKFCADALVF
jgi:hypothetical protein